MPMFLPQFPFLSPSQEYIFFLVQIINADKHKYANVSQFMLESMGKICLLSHHLFLKSKKFKKYIYVL